MLRRGFNGSISSLPGLSGLLLLSLNFIYDRAPLTTHEGDSTSSFVVVAAALLHSFTFNLLLHPPKMAVAMQREAVPSASPFELTPTLQSQVPLGGCMLLPQLLRLAILL